MAQKRMFDKSITNSDDFLEMPDSSQNLYFHLSMNADDDGFVNNWKSIMRMTGHKDDDLKVLVAKQFIIPFDSGVIVIKHWRINNYLRTDRYIETKFKEEKSHLIVDDSLVYQVATNGIHSIEENSIDKNSIEKKEIYKERKFKKPTLIEVEEYCKERNNEVDPQKFIDFYESKGWLVGKSPMKDWKACIRTWEQRSTAKSTPKWFNEDSQTKEVSKEELEEMERILNAD